MGFIQDVHPGVTYQDDYRYNLEEAIHLEMTETERENPKEALPASKKRDNTREVLKPEIKLEIVARNIAFGKGEAHIKMDAFEVRVPPRNTHAD
jgi:hypothetical protein